MNKGLNIQYGCGWSAPREWINFDASPTLRFERIPLIGQLYTKNKSRFPNNVLYGDIVKGLPISQNSCERVYCSHVLEHLSLEDFNTVLGNSYSILRPGGIFRFVLPDLEYLVKQYCSNTSSDAAIVFIRESGLGREKRARNLKDFFISTLGNSQHLWMWDYKSVEQELKETGFVGIRKAFFGDSGDDMFQKVEEIERWDNCLGVECKKPG
jgi:predicted SAM-dependent methyltransferase